MMTGCHQLDSLLTRSNLCESLKKKTLYAISRSNLFSAGLIGVKEGKNKKKEKEGKNKNKHLDFLIHNILCHPQGAYKV